jgi:lysyl-tRNA synthetase class 2
MADAEPGDRQEHDQARDSSASDQREQADQRAQRLNNLASLVERGLEPYPYSFEATHTTAALRASHGGLEPGARAADASKVTVAGRVMLKRMLGKLTFATLQDDSGRIQVSFQKDKLEQYNALKKIDLGDWLEVSGEIYATQTGELTIDAGSFRLLAKALRPLPSKHHGLVDKEARYRQRYLDLIANEESKRAFVLRAKAVSFIRRYLDDKGFLEVETPVLQAVPGGADARPFETHHNALDHDFHLRISLELYLKRLVVGGFEAVYEIGRVFRNEGISYKHNPEYTMLELYWAGKDYLDILALVEEMYSMLVERLTGSMVLTYQGQQLDFTPPWPRVDYTGELASRAGMDFDPMDEVRLRAWTAETFPGSTATGDASEPPLAERPLNQLFDKLYDIYVEPHLVGPVFVMDHPLAISPLAKKHRTRPGLVERFEPVVVGMELGNAFSELNDPLDQRERFEEQERLREGGNDEAQRIDEDFLVALEHGMPPTGGLGLGIDRIAMLLADVPSIRDVVLFPLLRPERSVG